MAADKESQSIGERIGDWDESPPVRSGPGKSLAEVDPRDKPAYMREFWIQKRRNAGLPDYPDPARIRKQGG